MYLRVFIYTHTHTVTHKQYSSIFHDSVGTFCIYIYAIFKYFSLSLGGYYESWLSMLVNIDFIWVRICFFHVVKILKKYFYLSM